MRHYIVHYQTKPTQTIQGKVVNLESLVSVHCTTLLGHVTIMRTSCFDTDFVSQIKLTTLPLIHWFAENRRSFLDCTLYICQIC